MDRLLIIKKYVLFWLCLWESQARSRFATYVRCILFQSMLCCDGSGRCTCNLCHICHIPLLLSDQIVDICWHLLMHVQSLPLCHIGVVWASQLIRCMSRRQLKLSTSLPHLPHICDVLWSVDGLYVTGADDALLVCLWMMCLSWSWWCTCNLWHNCINFVVCFLHYTWSTSLSCLYTDYGEYIWSRYKLVYKQDDGFMMTELGKWSCQYCKYKYIVRKNRSQMEITRAHWED